MQNCTVTIKKEKQLLVNFINNKKDNNLARGYNCMEEHVYQAIFRSTFDLFFEMYSTKM